MAKKPYKKVNESKGTKNVPVKEVTPSEVAKTLPDMDKHYKNPVGGGVKPITKQ